MRYPGHYSDGRTAERHEVSVQPHRAALHLYRATGERLDEWPYAGLYAAEEVYGDGPVRLRHRGRGEALLSLPSTALLAHVQRLSGRRLRRHRLLRPSLAIAGTAGVLLLAVTAALLWGLPYLLAPLARWVPPAWEQALGERVLRGLSDGRPACTRSAGQEALQALAARLAVHAELPYPVRVYVLADDGVNALALPGGHVALLRGLLDQARGPDEVAGVLAHELAHLARRDPLRGLLRGAGTSLLLRALLGDSATLDAAAARMAQLLVLISYTRQDELQADRQGVRLLNAANVRGDGLAAFLRRLAGQQPATGWAWLSTHPLHAERIALIAADARGTGSALDPAQWEALRRICE